MTCVRVESIYTIMILKILLFFIFIAVTVVASESNKNISIDSLSSVLKSPYVHMKNESVVFEKINKIVSEGADKLQIVTDFDKTVTKQHENGKVTFTSVDILFKSKQMPKSTAIATDAAHSKYQAAMSNLSIPLEQKIQAKNEEYKVYQEKLQGFEFDRKEIEQLVHEYGPSFRNGTQELFLKLHNLSIPVVMFSAGFCDIIEEQLNENNVQFDNVKLVCNRLKFNGTMLDGMENHEKPITSMNKHEHMGEIVNPDVFKSRKNIILMGDHIRDAKIVSVYENQMTVLKIGFSYMQTAEYMKLYEDKFDIVLDDDQTMNVVLKILELI